MTQMTQSASTTMPGMKDINSYRINQHTDLVVLTMEIDPSLGPDQTAYHCRMCGPSFEPCEHLKTFIGRQYVQA